MIDWISSDALYLIKSGAAMVIGLVVGLLVAMIKEEFYDDFNSKV